MRFGKTSQLGIFTSVLIFYLSNTYAKDQSNPKVTIETQYGSFTAELYKNEAPITVNNFLRYVDHGYYKDIAFYRTVREGNQPKNPVKISVLQGGYSRIIDGKLLDLDEPWENIPHETTKQTGIMHLDGTLSMARWEPGTANGHFAIMIGDQPELNFAGKRNPDGQGFAAFGRVIEGMEVVKKIHQMPAKLQSLTPPVKIIRIFRAKKQTSQTTQK